MARYEWRIICEALDYWGLWDAVKREYVIETTRRGMEAYKALGLKGGKETMRARSTESLISTALVILFILSLFR